MQPPIPQSPVLPPALDKRLDTLYRNCRQMSLVTLLGLFLPIILVVIAPLGFLYHRWRKSLFQAPELQDDLRAIQTADKRSRNQWSQVSDTRGKLAYVYIHGSRLLFPTVVLSIIVLFIVVLFAYLAIQSRA